MGKPHVSGICSPSKYKELIALPDTNHLAIRDLVMDVIYKGAVYESLPMSLFLKKTLNIFLKQGVGHLQVKTPRGGGLLLLRTKK